MRKRKEAMNSLDGWSKIIEEEGSKWPMLRPPPPGWRAIAADLARALTLCRYEIGLRCEAAIPSVQIALREADSGLARYRDAAGGGAK